MRTTARSSGPAFRRAPQIARLRYAPHLVGSPQRGVEGNAREAINIIVNECRRSSASSKSLRHRRCSNQSRKVKNRAPRIHRMLSADANPNYDRGYSGHNNEQMCEDDGDSSIY